MASQPLETPGASAYYDSETRIVHITYRGYLTSEASSVVYAWLKKLVEEVGEENIYGEIFDFRPVLEFMPDNLMDARKKARGLNLRMELLFPVAMVVKDFYQEEILRGPMQNVPENTRKRIVRSPEEARAFFEEWHARHHEEA
ncbi:MAG: hypothetical protein MUE40_12425 [Anaerolineae bacterium]|nr:hypothetical protein [Anaerolineae bacterium]